MPCDYSKYPKNWRSIRNEILERAKNQCECSGECGGVIINGYYLTIDNRHSVIIDLSPCAINKFRCIEKHMRRPKTFKGRRVILTIAHTNKSRKTKCVRRDKLKAMCQPCHLNFDRIHRKKAVEQI